MIRGPKAAWLAAGVLAAVPIAAAGCGSSDSNSDSTSSGTSSGASNTNPNAPVAGPGGALTVSETEYALTPTDATVKHGPVKIDVANDGKIVHTLNVEGPNGDIELGKDLQAGQKGSFTANLPPGKYEWYCPIPGHKDLGMKGEITVQ
jgi:plastocyanin